jgi:hypothetical protein
MPDIDQEIKAYETIRDELETKHMGKWALVRDEKLVALYDTLEEVAEQAVSQFGSGPYLIRQVGAPPMTLPASLMYNLK